MKRKLCIILCFLLLISNIFFYVQYEKYKKNADHSFTLKVNRVVNYGLFDSIRDIDGCLEVLENKTYNTSDLYLPLKDLESSFKVTIETYSIMIPDVDMKLYTGGRYSDYMQWFYEDLLGYVRNLIQNIDTIEKGKIIEELQSLKNGLNYIKDNINEEILLKENPATIKYKWDNIMDKVIKDNPTQPAFIRYRDKHYR